MKNIILFFSVVACALCCGCDHRSAGFRSTGDTDLTFQVLPSSAAVTGSNAGSFLFRVIPSASGYENMAPAVKDSLMLRMDSAFHAEVQHIRSAPVFLQSVPNGVKRAFEFIADFDLNGAKKGDTISFVYQDKYINQKTYRVKTVIQ